MQDLLIIYNILSRMSMEPYGRDPCLPRAGRSNSTVPVE